MADMHHENCQCDECRGGFPAGFESWSDYWQYMAQEREAVAALVAEYEADGEWIKPC